LDETALAFLGVAYNKAEPREIKGQLRPVFMASDPANDFGFSMAVDRPAGEAYHRVITQLVDSGAIVPADIREQGRYAGEEFYEITPDGEAMLRNAGGSPRVIAATIYELPSRSVLGNLSSCRKRKDSEDKQFYSGRDVAFVL